MDEGVSQLLEEWPKQARKLQLQQNFMISYLKQPACKLKTFAPLVRSELLLHPYDNRKAWLLLLSSILYPLSHEGRKPNSNSSRFSQASSSPSSQMERYIESVNETQETYSNYEPTLHSVAEGLQRRLAALEELRDAGLKYAVLFSVLGAKKGSVPPGPIPGTSGT